MIFYLNNNLYLFLSNKTTGANLKLCIEEKGWKELLNIKSHLRLKTSPLYENIKLLQSLDTLGSSGLVLLVLQLSCLYRKLLTNTQTPFKQ